MISMQLRVVLFLKFLQAFGYYGLSIVLTSFLTKDFGFTDKQAGTMYEYISRTSHTVHCESCTVSTIVHCVSTIVHCALFARRQLVL